MGLFDGPIRRFALALCRHLDSRRDHYYGSAKESPDPYIKLRSAILGDAMEEISVAIRHIAGLESPGDNDPPTS